ncbi:MAG: type IV pilin protein [Candidatus Zixiibacteriota bacterium]
MKKKGFTLIELMIVVVIIGVLAGLAINRYNEVTTQAKYSQARILLNRIYKALSQFYAETGCFPDDVSRNTPPPGLCPDYLEEWPSREDDPFGTCYDYENHGGNIVITYLGKDDIHSMSWLFAAVNADPGEIIEIPGHDDLVIVVAEGVGTCP